MQQAKLKRGDKVYICEHKRPFTVMACNERFAVCTKPHFDTVLYFIADLEKGIRGTENLVFGLGAETKKQCQEMLARVSGKCKDIETAISHRNRCALNIVRVLHS